MNNLFKNIQAALWPKWGQKIASIQTEAQNLAGCSAEEVYAVAYRKAYWDAVVDLTESGMITPPRVVIPTQQQDPLYN